MAPTSVQVSLDGSGAGWVTIDAPVSTFSGVSLAEGEKGTATLSADQSNADVTCVSVVNGEPSTTATAELTPVSNVGQGQAQPEAPVVPAVPEQGVVTAETVQEGGQDEHPSDGTAPSQPSPESEPAALSSAESASAQEPALSEGGVVEAPAAPQSAESGPETVVPAETSVPTPPVQKQDVTAGQVTADGKAIPVEPTPFVDNAVTAENTSIDHPGPDDLRGTVAPVEGSVQCPVCGYKFTPDEEKES